MKPLLVFDYDGTIHNTIKIYENAFREVHRWLVEEGYAKDQPVAAKRIQSWLGMNYKDMWNDFMPELPKNIMEEAGRRIGKRMTEQIRSHQAEWYEGAAEVLDELKKDGWNMVLLSNCKTAYKNANWEEFHMNRWFLEFYDCQSFDFAPKTEIIHTIRKKYPGDCMVIGDRHSDMECARAGGSLFTGCLYGYGTWEELQAADYLAKDIRQLPNLLKKSHN